MRRPCATSTHHPQDARRCRRLRTAGHQYRRAIQTTTTHSKTRDRNRILRARRAPSLLRSCKRTSLRSCMARCRHDGHEARRTARSSLEGRGPSWCPHLRTPSSGVRVLQGHRFNSQEPPGTSDRSRHGNRATTRSSPRSSAARARRTGVRLSGQRPRVLPRRWDEDTSRRFLKGVRVPGGKDIPPKIRLHDLRHTHATIGLKAGVPVKVIAERLGHENPAFTMKQYAHVIQGMQADAARAISSFVRNAAPVTTESSPTTSPAFDVGLT